MKLPAYPRYKPGGVEWLGDVPEHWEAKRLRFVAGIQTGSTPSKSVDDNYSDEGLMWVKPDDLAAFEAITNTKEYLSEAGRKLSSPIRAGSALVCCIGTVGKFGFSKQEVATNQQINAVVFQLHKVTSAFGLYLIAATESEHLSRANKNVVSILNTTQQSNIAVPVPPLLEQQAIVEFLERETGRIDRLVSKKRELIERLKEKRTALISRTVTRGLPPAVARAAGLRENPPLKDSGLDWLGHIPKHWKVKPVFRIVETIQTGPFGSQLHSADYVDGGIPLINPAHIVASRLIPDELSSIDESTAVRLSRHRLRDGDIVMARRGEIGRCGVVGPEEAGWLCGTGSLVIRLRDCSAKYYATIFSGAGFSGLLELHAVGTTMLNLNPTIVGRMLVPFPPLPEQAAVAAYLDLQTAKLDALVGKVEEAVARLHEYRTALITAAVTGKIDVRKEVTT